MATEKIATTPRNDVFATQQELVLEGMAFASKQREELEKIGRESLERTGVMMRAGCQTALDAYDFGVKMMSTWQSMSEELVRTSIGMARKATAPARAA